jgi:hypothetical protein
VVNVIGPAMFSMIGVGRMERASDRDVWILRGGWGDGMEFTSQEVENASASPEAFMALVRSKTEQHMARVQRFPPRWWPGTDVPPRRLTPVGSNLMEAQMRYNRFNDDMVDSVRYSGPSMEPGATIRYVYEPRAEMSLERFKRDNPPKKKPVEEVTLKPRKYGKDR